MACFAACQPAADEVFRRGLDAYQAGDYEKAREVWLPIAETGHGRRLDIQGKVLTVCPTKIAMPGGATFVNEGLTEFTMGKRTGYGIAEHWHSIRNND